MKAIARIRAMAREQLVQGVEPQRLALGLALSFALGTFPLLGFSSLACLALGSLLRLNQPFLQAVNYLLYPLQLLLMPAFLRAGEWIFAQPPVPFSPLSLVRDFFASPTKFLGTYGKAGVMAVIAWAVFALVVCPPLYLAARSGFEAARRLKEDQ